SGEHSRDSEQGHVRPLSDEPQAIVYGVRDCAHSRVERISPQFGPFPTTVDRIRGSSERHDLELVAVSGQECAQASEKDLDWSIGTKVGVPEILLFHELERVSNDHDDQVFDIMRRVKQADLLTGC